jgi:hypothetical protein
MPDTRYAQTVFLVDESTEQIVVVGGRTQSLFEFYLPDAASQDLSPLAVDKLLFGARDRVKLHPSSKPPNPIQSGVLELRLPANTEHV